MKTIYTTLITVLTAAMLCMACNDSKDTVPPGNEGNGDGPGGDETADTVILSTDKVSFQFDDILTAHKVTVEEVENYDFDDVPQWIEISRRSGYFTIRATSVNESDEDRTGKITVYEVDKEDNYAVIEVMQTAYGVGLGGDEPNYEDWFLKFPEIGNSILLPFWDSYVAYPVESNIPKLAEEYYHSDRPKEWYSNIMLTDVPSDVGITDAPYALTVSALYNFLNTPRERTFRVSIDLDGKRDDLNMEFEYHIKQEAAPVMVGVVNMYSTDLLYTKGNNQSKVETFFMYNHLTDTYTFPLNHENKNSSGNIEEHVNGPIQVTRINYKDHWDEHFEFEIPHTTDRVSERWYLMEQISYAYSYAPITAQWVLYDESTGTHENVPSSLKIRLEKVSDEGGHGGRYEITPKTYDNRIVALKYWVPRTTITDRSTGKTATVGPEDLMILADIHMIKLEDENRWVDDKVVGGDDWGPIDVKN